MWSAEWKKRNQSLQFKINTAKSCQHFLTFSLTWASCRSAQYLKKKNQKLSTPVPYRGVQPIKKVSVAYLEKQNRNISFSAIYLNRKRKKKLCKAVLGLCQLISLCNRVVVRYYLWNGRVCETHRMSSWDLSPAREEFVRQVGFSPVALDRQEKGFIVRWSQYVSDKKS